MKKLSIIIPTYNEERTIKELLTKVKNVSLENEGVEKEIIVVDDGSKDSTINIIKNIKGIRLIKHEKNLGKGGAVKTGINAATGDIIIVQDADLEYDPNDYSKLIKPIIEKKFKVVYGSRFLTLDQKKEVVRLGIKKHRGAYLKFFFGGFMVTLVTNVLFFSNLTDEATCYKVFDAKLIKSIKINCNRFDWEPEVTAKILKRGIKIKEIPISYNPRSIEEGKKIAWGDGVKALYILLKYRFVD